jgi:crossover junction endodeoxyribonuclease RuvC
LTKPDAKDFRILALDLSLSSPGFAVLSVTDRIPTLVDVNHVKTNAKQTHGQRLAEIQAKLIAFISRHYPYDTIVREKGFSLHAATTQALYKVVGVIDLTFADDGQIREFSPTTVKKTVTGDGKADKVAVEIAVRRLLRLPPLFRFATDDESDAAAVGLTYLIAEGMIDAGGSGT